MPEHLSQPRPLKYYSSSHSSLSYLLRIIHPPHPQNPQNPFLQPLSNYLDLTLQFYTATSPHIIESQQLNLHLMLTQNTHISPQPTPQILHNSVIISALQPSNSPLIAVSITVTAPKENLHLSHDYITLYTTYNTYSLTCINNQYLYYSFFNSLITFLFITTLSSPYHSIS